MIATRPIFSVVIPTFNRGPYIGDAIRSVLDQTFRDFELIVVDDGSTDNSVEVLRQFARNAKIITQENCGVSVARNRGVAEAKGRWLAFLDSDDRWHPGYLEAQHRWLVSGEPVLMQCANCVIHFGGTRVSSYFALNGVLNHLAGAASILMDRPCSFVAKHGPWQIGATVIDAEAFRRSGGFDQSLSISEDLDLLARIGHLGLARFTADAMVDILRRDDLFDSLSKAADRQPLHKRMTHDRIYAKLEGLPGLDRNDRDTLRRLRSANRRSVGNLLRDSGDRAGAFRAFWDAFCLSPSARSLGKLCFSVLP